MKRFSKIFCGVIPAVFAGVFAFVSAGCLQDISGTDKVDKIVTSYGNRTVSVTFDSNGGTEVSPSTIEVNIGECIGALPVAPSRAGYSFNGWNMSKDGTGVYFGEDTVVTDSLTVYAAWEPTGTTLSVNLDIRASYYGVAVSNTPSAVATVSIGSKNFTVATKPVSQDSAWILSGWCDDDGNLIATADGKLVPDTYYADENGIWQKDIPSGSVTFHAKWEHIKLIKEASLNGGAILVLSVNEEKTFYGSYSPADAPDSVLPVYNMTSSYFEVTKLECSEGNIAVTVKAKTTPIALASSSFSYNSGRGSFAFKVQVKPVAGQAVKSIDVVSSADVALGETIELPVRVTPADAVVNFSLSGTVNYVDAAYDATRSAVIVKGILPAAPGIRTTYTLKEIGSNISKTISLSCFIDTEKVTEILDTSSSASSSTLSDYKSLSLTEEKKFFIMKADLDAGKTYYIETSDSKSSIGNSLSGKVACNYYIFDSKGNQKASSTTNTRVTFAPVAKETYYVVVRPRNLSNTGASAIHVYSEPALSITGLPSSINYCAQLGAVEIPFTYEVPNGGTATFTVTSSNTSYMKATYTATGTNSAKITLDKGSSSSLKTSRDTYTVTLRDTVSGNSWVIPVKYSLPAGEDADGAIEVGNGSSNALDDYTVMEFSSTKRVYSYAVNLKANDPLLVETSTSNTALTPALSPRLTGSYYLVDSFGNVLVNNTSKLSYVSSEDCTCYLVVFPGSLGSSGKMAVHAYAEESCIDNLSLSETYVSLLSGTTKTLTLNYDAKGAKPNFTVNYSASDVVTVQCTSTGTGQETVTINAKAPGDTVTVTIRDTVSYRSVQFTASVTVNPDLVDGTIVPGTDSSSVLSDYTVVNFTSEKYVFVYELNLVQDVKYTVEHSDSNATIKSALPDRKDSYFYIYDKFGARKVSGDDGTFTFTPSVTDTYYFYIRTYSPANTTGAAAVHVYRPVITSLDVSPLKAFINDSESPCYEIPVTYSGTGSYELPSLKVTSSDETVAVAACTPNSKGSEILKITGKSNGYAAIEVKDQASGLSQTVDVLVIFDCVDIIPGEKASSNPDDFSTVTFTEEKKFAAYKVEFEDFRYDVQIADYNRRGAFLSNPVDSLFYVYDESGNYITSTDDDDFDFIPGSGICYVVITPSDPDKTGDAGIYIHKKATASLSYSSPAMTIHSGFNAAVKVNFDAHSAANLKAAGDSDFAEIYLDSCDYVKGEAILMVKPLKEGSSTITVTDTISGLTANLAVTADSKTVDAVLEVGTTAATDINQYAQGDIAAGGRLCYKVDLEAGKTYKIQVVDSYSNKTMLDGVLDAYFGIYNAFGSQVASWDDRDSTYKPAVSGTYTLEVWGRTGKTGKAAVFIYE